MLREAVADLAPPEHEHRATEDGLFELHRCDDLNHRRTIELWQQPFLHSTVSVMR